MFEARKLYGLLFILLLLAPAAFGQEFTGNITGRLTDSTGAVIPGVNISLTSPAIQTARQAISGETGGYQFLLLPVGTYSLKFELPGFKTIIREGVSVEVLKNVNVSQVMEVAATAETVTVTGDAPVVDVQNATLGVNFNQSMLRDIPNSRDIWIVLGQSPGINTTRYDVGGSTMGSQTGFRSYGTTSQNWFTLDGIVTNDSAGAAGWYFDYGSFQEIQVSAAANAAEVPVPGALMNMVVKSGTNDLHGQAYIDWESKKFQAHNLGSDVSRVCPAPAAAATFSGPCGLFTGDAFSRYNDFNVNAGGKVIKDKLWWFVSWRDQYSDLTTQLGLTDSAVSRYGMPGSGSNAAVDALSVVQGGHYTTRLRIPTLKLTWQVTPKNNFQFVWQHSRKKAPYRNGSGASANQYIVESTGDQHDPSDGRKAEWTMTVSPRMTLDFKATDSEYIFPQYSHVEKTPISDSITQFKRGGFSNPNVGWRKHWDWGGNASYFKTNLAGSHNFKVGYDLYWEYARNYNMTYPGGGYSLSLNNGVPNTFTIKDGPYTSAQGVYQNAIFFQDKWQIGRKLVINVGGRFDRYANYYPAQGNPHNGIFDITAIKAFYASLATPTNILLSMGGATSVPRKTVSVFKNWVPRFALAYDLFGNGRTAIKASASKFSWNPSTLSNINPNVNPTYTFKWPTDPVTGFGILPITQALITSKKANGIDPVVAFQSQSVPAAQVLDPNLTNSWSDEYTVGIDQSVFRDFGVRANYVRKLEQNPYASVDTTRDINSFAPVTKVDPGRDGIVGTSDDANIVVYNLLTAFQNVQAINVTKNFPGYGANYSTIEVIATKRMSNKWMAMVSVDKTKRNLAQNTALDPNALAWGSNNSAHIWDWSLKTVFQYQLPYGINFTTTYDAQKGETYQRTVTITGLLQGNVTATVEKQGENFYPTSKLWNLRAEKKIKIREKQTIDADFDLFNIPNLATVVGWTTASNSPYLFKNQVNTIINPRIFRLGARYNF